MSLSRVPMEQLLTLSLIIATCGAVQDLSGKMFTFAVESNTDHVRLMPSGENFTSVSTCLRSFTDLNRNHALFSLATPTQSNDLLLFKRNQDGEIELAVRSVVAIYQGQSYELNAWHSVCLTWDSNTGLGQIWLDGKLSSRKFLHSGSSINGPPIIILGQEQDSYGGRFDKTQSFVRMLTDVHMWDYVLSPCEIQRFMSDLNFTPGNVLNWRALEFTINGKVVVEYKQMDCNH